MKQELREVSSVSVEESCIAKLKEMVSEFHNVEIIKVVGDLLTGVVFEVLYVLFITEQSSI